MIPLYWGLYRAGGTMSSSSSLPMFVESRIIIGEKAKRPQLYREALRAVLENPGLVSLQAVESNLDKVFLRTVLGEAILRKPRLQSNLVVECASAKQKCTRYLWLDGLRVFSEVVRGSAEKLEVSSADDLSAVEEALRYGVPVRDVSSAKELFVRRFLILKEESRIGPVLSRILSLAHEPSAYPVEVSGDSRIAVVWPYIVVLKPSERICEVRLLGRNIAEVISLESISREGRSAELELRAADNWVIVVLRREGFEREAYVYRLDPSGDGVAARFALRGLSIVFSTALQLFFVLDRSEKGGLQIKVFNTSGTLVASRLISESVNLTRDLAIHGFEAPGGVLFIVSSEKSSRILYYSHVDGSVVTKAFDTPIDGMVSLPTRILVLYSLKRGELFLFDTVTGKVAGSYPLTVKVDYVFPARSGGILGFAEGNIYVLDALGNVSKSIEISGFDKFSVLNTYLYTLAYLYRSGRVEKIVVLHDGEAIEAFVREATGDEIVDVQYANSTLYFVTKRYVYAVSPSIFLEMIRKMGAVEIPSGFGDATGLSEVEERLGALRIQLKRAGSLGFDVAQSLVERLAKDAELGSEFLDVLQIHLEEVTDIVGELLALQRYNYLAKSLVSIDCNSMSTDCAPVATTLARIARLVDRIPSCTSIEACTAVLLKILPANEVFDVGELLRNLFTASGVDRAVFKNVRGALIRVAKDSRYEYAREDAYRALKTLGVDLRYVEGRIKGLLAELERTADVDTVRKVEGLLRDALDQGETELAQRALANLSTFLGYLYEKLLTGIETSLNPTSYSDVREFIRRCVSEIPVDEGKLKKCRRDLDVYTSMFGKLIEEIKQVSSLAEKSRYVKVDPLKTVLGAETLEEGLRNLASLTDKVKKSVELEGTLASLLHEISKLPYKPLSFEADVKQCEDFLRQLLHDDAERCIKNLKDRIETVKRTAESLERVRSAISCPEIEVEVRDVEDSIRQNEIEKAQKKAEELESVISLYNTLGHLVDTIIQSFIRIGVDEAEARGLGARLKCSIIGEIYSDRTKVSKVRDAVYNIVVKLSRVAEKIGEAVAKIEGSANLFKVVGAGDYVERLKESVRNVIRDSALRAVKLCGDSLSSCITAVEDLDRVASDLRNTATSMTASLHKLRALVTHPGEVQQVYIQAVLGVLRVCSQPDPFELMKCIASSAEKVHTRRDAVKVLAEIERLIEGLKLKSNIGVRIGDIVKEFIRREISNAMVAEVDAQSLAEKYRSLSRKAPAIIDTLIRLDQTAYELNQLGVNTSSIVEELDKKVERIDLESLQSELSSLLQILQSIRSLYDRYRNAQLLKAVLQEPKRLNSSEIAFLELLFGITRRYGINEEALKVLERHRGSRDDEERYIEGVLRELAVIAVKKVVDVKASSKTEEDAAAHFIFIDYADMYGEQPLTCTDVSKWTEITGFAAKAVNSYCNDNDVGRASLYGLLSYAAREKHFSIVFNLLGGPFKNMLVQTVRQIEDYVNVENLKHLALWRCISKPFVESVLGEGDKRREIATCIYNFGLLKSNIRKVADLLSKLSKVLDRDYVSKHILDIFSEMSILIEKGYEGLADKYEREYLRIEYIEPVDPNKERPELQLRVTNGGSFPITITKLDVVTAYGSTLLGSYTKEIKLKPHSSEEIRVPISRIPQSIPSIAESYVELQIRGEMYMVEPSLGSKQFSHVLTVPLTMPPHVQALRKIYDMIRIKLGERVDLGRDVNEVFVATGRYNVVLRGRDRKTGEDIVVKIPVIAVEMTSRYGSYTIPSLVLEEQIKLEERKNIYLKTSSRCRNVVPILEVLIDPPCILEKYVEGKSLRKLYEDGKAPTRRDLLRIVLDVGKTVKCLHQFGVYHNDIRPDNIILTSSGEAVLIDIGVDEIFRELFRGYLSLSGAAVSGRRALEEDVEKRYIPEWLRESLSAMDERSRSFLDLYQLVILLYELLTGSNPNLSRNCEPIPGLSEELNDLAGAVCRHEIRDPQVLDKFIELLEGEVRRLE